MNGGSIHLIKLFGIPIRIHVSWVIIFLLVTWTLASGYFPSQYPHWPPLLYWVVGLITSFCFFGSVVLHELAHSVVATARGMKVRDIVLFVFGGVSELGEEPASATTEFLMAVVGPVTSFLLSLLAAGLWLLTRNVSEPVGAICYYLALINVVLAIFNMIPGFPLDGGRLFRSVLWGITGDLDKATRWAVGLGIAVAWGLMALGIVLLVFGQLNGLWFALIGWFLKSAAQSTFDRTRLKRALQGVPVRQVMNAGCAVVEPEVSVGAVIQELILARGIRCVPVVQGDQLLGLITVHNARAIPQEQWNSVQVRDVMIPAGAVKAIGPDNDLWAAMEEMTEEGVNQLPVIENGRLLGMVGRDALMGYLRMRAELGI